MSAYNAGAEVMRNLVGAKIESRLSAVSLRSDRAHLGLTAVEVEQHVLRWLSLVVDAIEVPPEPVAPNLRTLRESRTPRMTRVSDSVKVETLDFDSRARRAGDGGAAGGKRHTAQPARQRSSRLRLLRAFRRRHDQMRQWLSWVRAPRRHAQRAIVSRRGRTRQAIGRTR